jgi:hypothetical protein
LTDGKQKAFRPHWRSIFSFVFKEQSGHPPESGHAKPPQFRATSATGFWGRVTTLSETLRKRQPDEQRFSLDDYRSEMEFPSPRCDDQPAIAGLCRLSGNAGLTTNIREIF